jgi:hypothetical protein
VEKLGTYDQLLDVFGKYKFEQCGT